MLQLEQFARAVHTMWLWKLMWFYPALLRTNSHQFNFTQLVTGTKFCPRNRNLQGMLSWPFLQWKLDWAVLSSDIGKFSFSWCQKNLELPMKCLWKLNVERCCHNYMYPVRLRWHCNVWRISQSARCFLRARESEGRTQELPWKRTSFFEGSTRGISGTVHEEKK